MTTPQNTISNLSAGYLITLYIGGNPYLASVSSRDENFMLALETELARRGIRSLDNSVGWDVSIMPDEDLQAIEDYLGEIWIDIKDGMLKTIKEGWEKKRQAQKEST
jgi:hypothetical protein